MYTLRACCITRQVFCCPKPRFLEILLEIWVRKKKEISRNLGAEKNWFLEKFLEIWVRKTGSLDIWGESIATLCYKGKFDHEHSVVAAIIFSVLCIVQYSLGTY